MLLLVHGHPFDHTMWHPQLARFDAVAPDLRGYGAAEPARGVTPMSAFADDLAAIAPGEVVLCGLSMGGQVAMEFHRRYPERVRALILADTTARAETPDSRQDRLDMADRLSREGMEPYAREVLWKMVSPGNDAAAEHVLKMMLSAPPEGAAAAQRGRADRPDYRESLRAHPVPTLVVVGSEDVYTPLDEVKLIPATHVVEIRGAAHLPNLERPEEFNDAVAGFLATL
ncbi:alpha/beta fold hydrolase [Actinokineospora globicatena]|uniref:alpha/beta fold hydrolase n=1 Tax=Actinokineospora globicatena TaxID=103729 RepID=UPI0020A4E50E|nr:alpha/beta fold hydrolase [Actinokineospora globicatena]MCP2300706.1 Pimeloyl-ACP methyl ester carboxylesterase [Actinokineospora globicatena]GLW77669.1 alpha/beta hydrolase [Actinokineospora globicatena]GLW84505.1 alpha/beta hydrolase [Actinokineospora globicatena]